MKEIFKFGGENLITELQGFFAAMLYPRDIDRVSEVPLSNSNSQNDSFEIADKDISHLIEDGTQIKID